MRLVRSYNLGIITIMSFALTNMIAADNSEPLTGWFMKSIHGRSTYYGNYQGGGACGLDQPDGMALPPEVKGIDFTVALDQAQFNLGGCGMCIQLTGTGVGAGGNPVTGNYTVFVNNLCPECEFGHLDFATPGDGSWDIEWKAIPCDVGDHKMRFVFMGSNDFYLKVSTQAARVPTKALRLKVGEEWKEGTPVHGSYFEFRDGAPFSFPIEVEVTSVFGEVLKDEIVSLQGGPSTIQYDDRRAQPTDGELAAAQWGEEPPTDDDIEEGPAPSATEKPHTTSRSDRKSYGNDKATNSTSAPASPETVADREAMLLDGGRGMEEQMHEKEEKEEMGRALSNGHKTETAALRQLLRGAGVRRQATA
ncbi:hypothetical protein VYU27_008950 [Nannochloropsis oceanica]